MLKLKKIPLAPKREDECFDSPMGLSSYYPSFAASNLQIKEVQDWDVGETYRIILDVKMTSKRKGMDEPANGGFDIVAYKAFAKKSLDNLTDKEFEEYQGEQMELMNK